MTAQSEERARCWSCGYQLRGLEGTICPECGRAFDPNDPATFDRRDPEKLRRKRIRNALIAIGVLAVLIPVFPRKMLRGKIAFQCGKCRIEQTTTRWEPVMPEWIGLRLPGFHWRSGLTWSPDRRGIECSNHNFDRLKAEVWTRPTLSMHVTGQWNPGERLLINNIVATPESSVEILWNAMNPKRLRLGTTIEKAEMPENPAPH